MTALFKSFTVEIISHSLSLSKASPTLMISMSLQYWKILRSNSFGRNVNPFSSQAICKITQDITIFFYSWNVSPLCHKLTGAQWMASNVSMRVIGYLTLDDQEGQVQIYCEPAQLLPKHTQTLSSSFFLEIPFPNSFN